MSNHPRLQQWSKRAALSMTVSISLFIGLAACQPKTADDSQTTAPTTAQTLTDNTDNAASGTTHTATSAIAKKTISVDWSKVDSGEKAVDKNRFAYPFKLDSEPVKAYAEMYNVDKETARYNLTVGMAVNEVLSKVLDQIDTAYVSHELTAGKDSKFIIHTTKTVNPSSYQYVFIEPFAKGLTIPVEIKNDGQKITRPNPHASAIRP